MSSTEAPPKGKNAPKGKSKKGKSKPKAVAPAPLSPEQQKRKDFEELLKRRFFFVSSFEIYGGVKGLFDFGPPGAAMMTELQSVWRDFFIIEDDLLPITTTTITPEEVFRVSGHVDKFEDKMCKDEVTGDCHRADHLLEDHIDALIAATPDMPEEEKSAHLKVRARADDFSLEELTTFIRSYEIKAPDTGNPLSDPYPFNLMFSSQVGPTGKLKGYLRPETAQGTFVNFNRLLDYNSGRLPFGTGQIGLAYRNEIAPRNSLIRVREFAMGEVEYFVDPENKDHPKFDVVKDVVVPLLTKSAQLENGTTISMSIGEAVESGLIDNQTLGYYIGRAYEFLVKVGADATKIRFRQHLSNEMAHYATDCWDGEMLTTFGWIECIGNADRACYDLHVHEVATKKPMQAFIPYPEGPRKVELTQLKANNGLIGKTFKKDARTIIAALPTEQAEIEALRDSIAGKETFELAGFTLDSSMVSFSTVTKNVAGRNVQPSVIEPSYGLGRIMYCILEHSYSVRPGDDEARAVLSLAPVVSPVKCAIIPLMVKPELMVFVRILEKQLRKAYIACKADVSGVGIGRKYARVDEIGSPFAATIDYDTIKENTVTLRERDSMDQIRVPISDLSSIISSLSLDEDTWANVSQKYPKV
eukprot:TRINITY_DN4137_c0_g1_i1.p1 TRINITY_DN4137_c0_g1~~TRINITY_DN4137_c0_g1_i1.p1  ORF type:complete len:642 (+),score=175.79 TRINITY_DN4137_c0_g1_i1:17-1942(+)